MKTERLVPTMLFLLAACTLIAGCGSDIVAPVEDEAPVLPPENVTAIQSPVDKLVIRWDPCGHPQLRGYHVYRAEVVSQSVTRLTGAPIPETQYRDLTARRGVQYEYRVTAITKAGKESTYRSTLVTLEADPEQDPEGSSSKKTFE